MLRCDLIDKWILGMVLSQSSVEGKQVSSGGEDRGFPEQRRRRWLMVFFTVQN